ncbi:MAG TPA: polysaccharide biosynthesis tyrosine autokinase [Planctomycetes bacterium]|nr:polysaccharide biosynthesis tyrosine autokinase [Planctomycetota bacterium]
MEKVTAPAPTIALATQGEVNPLYELVRFLRSVRYRKGTILAALAVSCILGALYYLTAPRIYESTASLLVLQIGSDTWQVGMSGERVAKDLMPTYQNMFTGEEVLKNALAQLKPPDLVDFRAVSPKERVKKLRDQLNVSLVRGANILNVAYRSRDPRAAAAVVRSLLSAYLAFMDRLHRSTAREILEILTRDKSKLEEQLRRKEAELVQTRSRAGELVIRDAQDGLSVVVKRALELNSALTEAIEDRLEAEAQYRAVDQAVRNGEDLQQYVFSIMDSVGRQVLLQRLGLDPGDTYTVSRMNEQLLQNTARLKTLLQRYGPAHHEVQEAQERIRIAEEYLRNRHRNQLAQLRQISDRELRPVLIQMARQRLEQARQHEQAVRRQYEVEMQRAIALDRDNTELTNLELDLDRLRRYYDAVLQRIKDVDLGEQNGMVRTAVLTQPEVPTAPVSPRLVVVAFLAVTLGLAVGLAVVYVQDLLDDRFRSPEELQLQLGVSLLALLQEFEPLAERGIGALHAHVRPDAVETEAFRTLRTALSLARGQVRSLVISSSEPGDGKTTVSANLAAVYAQAGKRTLLVDADMRRPGLTPLLDLKGPKGLSGVLRHEAPVPDVVSEHIRPDVLPNLDVLPAGPRPTNPAELLATDRFHELLAWAETVYDQVIIDSPPAMVADAAIIGRLVDGLVLVMQPEKNPRRMVTRIVESLSSLEIKILGVVVNRLSGKNSESYYGYGYGYGYSYRYGHRYGYGQDEEATEAAAGTERLKRPVRRSAREAA